jgi:hypothetical protein
MGILNSGVVSESQGDCSDIEAEDVPFTPSGNIVSTNVQTAIEELDADLVNLDESQTLTNKTIDADSNTISNIGNEEIKAGVDAVKIADGSVSNTEFQHLDGVTSDIQGQLDDKVDTITSTDNAIVRYTGTEGQVQNSVSFVDDNGYIGVGVSSPLSPLHISENSDTLGAKAPFLIIQDEDNSSGSKEPIVEFRDDTGTSLGQFGAADSSSSFPGIFFRDSSDDETLFIDNATGNVSIYNNINLEDTTFAEQNGIIYKNGELFLHNFNYGDNGTVTTSGYNTFVGESSGNFTMGETATATTQGSSNSGYGFNSLKSLTLGSANFAGGSSCLVNLTTGLSCVAIGSQTLYTNETSSDNIAIGKQTMYSSTAAARCVAIGSASMLDIQGDRSTAVGYQAGRYIDGLTSNINSINSVYLGYRTKASADGNSNETVIGYDAVGKGSNTVTLGNDSVNTTYLKGEVEVEGTIYSKNDGVDDVGKVNNRYNDIWATNNVIQTSDRDKKDEIEDLTIGLDFVNKLKPVSFKWKDIVQEEVKEIVTIERQKVETKVVQQETSKIVLEDGKYIKKYFTKEVIEEEPVYEEVDLYDEVGEIIGKHEIPVMETVEEEKVIEKEINNTHSRKHSGLIAQDVKEVLDDLGIDTKDFAGYIDTGDNGLGLRYQEFISPLIKAIQEQQQQINELLLKIGKIDNA